VNHIGGLCCHNPPGFPTHHQRTRNWFRHLHYALAFVVHDPESVASSPRFGSRPINHSRPTFLGPLDHGLGRLHLGLADGARRFDIDDDAELHVDQIVVGLSEEG
jgi:hypothetical protein